MQRLHALLILAWGFVRAFFSAKFGARRGLAAFRASYASDRLPSFAEDERAAATTFSRCIACGLCDRGEGERIARSGGAYRGVMDLMLTSSRGIPDFDAAAKSFAFVPDDRLEALEPVCPTGVPMRAVKRFVLAKAEAIACDQKLDVRASE